MTVHHPTLVAQPGTRLMSHPQRSATNVSSRFVSLPFLDRTRFLSFPSVMVLLLVFFARGNVAGVFWLVAMLLVFLARGAVASVSGSWRFDTRHATGVGSILKCHNRMRFTWLDPGGHSHCCLAKISLQHTPPYSESARLDSSLPLGEIRHLACWCLRPQL
jgi:hypothetical protein